MRLALLSLARRSATADRLVVDAAGTPSAIAAAEAAEVDAALAELGPLAGSRLVVDAADLAGANLVLARLLRRGLLAELETALLLDQPGRYLTGLGLPAEPARQLAVATAAGSRLVGVLKDDSGGLCLDSAELRSWGGQGGWWVRAVVDDQRLCDGTVRSLAVRRLGPDELEATVTLGRLRRHSCRGRSLQLACDPAQIIADGLGRQQPRRKRTFWSEPTLWRLALPAA